MRVQVVFLWVSHRGHVAFAVGSEDRLLRYAYVGDDSKRSFPGIRKSDPNLERSSLDFL